MMRSRIRSYLPTVAAMAVGALLAGSAPLAAAVYDALNADKVDGLHAVGAGATVAGRAGKLVATNSTGRLPNDIVAKPPNADRLDGLDSTALQKRVTGTCAADQKMTAIGAAGGTTCAADRINGGNAQTLDGLDSTQLARVMRTVVVGPVGTPAQNGAALGAALATIASSGSPSATNRWLLKVEPGTYDVTALTKLTMVSHVDIEGSGAATVITCACSASNQGTSGTVIGAADSELRDLKVINTGGLESWSIAVNQATTLRNVVLEASGAAAVAGVNSNGLTLIDSTIEAVGNEAYGALIYVGPHTIDGSRLSAVGDTAAVALEVQSDVAVRDSELAISDPGDAGGIIHAAVNIHATKVTFEGSRLVADAGLTAVNLNSGTLHIATSMIQGIAGSAVTATMTCVHSYSGSFTALGTDCQEPAPEPPS